jgi:predicted PurR-regulated permease PerM
MNIFDSRRERAQTLLAALGIAILVAVLPLLAGLLGALVLFVAAAPVHRRLTSRLSTRASATVIVAATAVLIFLPAAWLLSVAVDRAPDAINQLRDSTVWARLSVMRVGSIDVGTRLADAGGSIISLASSQALRVVGSAMRGTINAVVALFGLYFLLTATPDAWPRISAYLPFSTRGAELLARRFHEVTEATLLGTALTAVLQGIVVALGFAVTGLSDPWFWGAITAIVSVLPVLGSALVWLPGVIALMIEGRYGAAIGLFAIGALVASNIDNVMRPVVNRRVSNLHPMTTLVGVFAGVGVLGLPGILLGPVAITYFFELVALYREEYGNGVHGAESPAVPSTSGGHASESAVA